MSYKYEGHVKVIGIVEIVLQVIASIIGLVLLGFLIFGTSTLLIQSEAETTSAENKKNTAVFSGIFIAVIIVVILALVFNAWLVYLVFTGGQTKNKSRLTIWYVIHSVLLALTILGKISSWAMGTTLLNVIGSLIGIIYRAYSIHIVRCHVAEISALTPTPQNNKF